LPDCPWNFSNDPRYKHDDDGLRKASIKALNKSVLNEPRMLQAGQDILDFLLRPITGKKTLSAQNRQMLKEVSANAISMPGLSIYPYLYAPMQAMLFGSRFRVFGEGESADLPAEPEQPFITGLPQKIAARKKTRRKITHEVTYENVGMQRLEFELDGKKRVDIVPAALRLCLVYRGDAEVKHVPILSGPDRKPVEFPLTRAFLRSVAKTALEARRENAHRAELAVKLPGYKGGRPKQGRPVAKGQQHLL
jgi:hypothetical protein